MAESPGKSSTYVARIGAHHFAHLRAVAEGVSISEAAARYLAIDHGHQAVTAHRRVVDHLRSLARRRGDKTWRLLGLVIRLRDEGQRPSLEDFMAERDLEDWSQQEVLSLYEEAYPSDVRTERRHKLREKQLKLLRELEAIASEQPQLTDPLEAWLDEVTAARLRTAGLESLADLVQRIQEGGQWWRGVPAVGAQKADRIREHLQSLLPDQSMTRPAQRFLVDAMGRLKAPTPNASIHPEIANARSGASSAAPPPLPFAPAQNALKTGFRPSSAPENEPPTAPLEPFFSPTQPSGGLGGVLSLQRPKNSLPGDFGNFAVPASVPNAALLLIDAQNDLESISAWVAARAGSIPTAKSYRREAFRWLLWLNEERGRGFREARVEDCLAYMAFLENLPPRWVSRRHSSAVMDEGWAPFRGSLSLASRRQAVIVLGSFFGWLVDVGYLPQRNPWMLVNRRTGDDRRQHELDSRAFTPEAWAAIQQHLARQPPSPSLARIVFLLQFLEATGLRAAELLKARLGDFRTHKGRLALQVQGKGSRNRVVAVPGQAADALARYLHQRGLPEVGSAPAELPLLASTVDPKAPVGYQAMYQTIKRWVAEGLKQSTLPAREQALAVKASPHWLRHTFGTRALERKAPLEVVQRQLGHADPRTTMRYAKAQLERMQAEMEQVFEGDPRGVSRGG